jgi:hypothetical protein
LAAYVGSGMTLGSGRSNVPQGTVHPVICGALLFLAIVP